MSVNFNWGVMGGLPEENYLLHMYVTGDVIQGAFTFRIFIGILSYP